MTGHGGARRLDGAGVYTASSSHSTTNWVEHPCSDHLGVGTYSVATGGTDDQVPHTEDEV